MAKNATLLTKELKKIRIDHDITRAQMAEAIGLTEKQLVDMENGRAEMPDPLIDALCEFYECHDLYDDIRGAAMAALSHITFDLTALTLNQRSRVYELRQAIRAEQAA